MEMIKYNVNLNSKSKKVVKGEIEITLNQEVFQCSDVKKCKGHECEKCIFNKGYLNRKELKRMIIKGNK